MAGTTTTRFSPTLTGVDTSKGEVCKEFTFASDTYPAGGFSVKVSDYLSSILDVSVAYVALASSCTGDFVARYVGKSADESHVFVRLFRAGSSAALELATGTVLTDGAGFRVTVKGARL